MVASRAAGKVSKASPPASTSEPSSPTGEGTKKRQWGSATHTTGSPTSSCPGSPTSATMEESLRKRNESLSKALAKAQSARNAAAQRAEEIRRGEEWTELFKIPANRRDAEMLAQFWEEVKIRLLKRFGSLHLAIKKVGGDGGNVGFLKFCDLLRLVNFPLNQSICRAMFDKVATGHREMPVDSFKALLMERTIRAMRFVMEGWNGKQARVKSHIRLVLRRLAEADDTNQDRAVDRFQRKLTVTFIRDFWQLLLKRLGGSRSEDVSISKPTLLKILMDEEDKGHLQAHEVLYLLRIFERVARQRANFHLATRGGISVCHFLTGIVLLSPIQEARDKVGLIFEVFDNDYDSCLLYEQIHEMCECICILKPMAEESLQGAEDETFQAELAQQEGQRTYECIRWYLQRTGNVQGSIVSMPELWRALEMQPPVLQALLPGLARIRWASKAVPGEDLEEIVHNAIEEAKKAAGGGVPAVEITINKKSNAKGASQPGAATRNASKSPAVQTSSGATSAAASSGLPASREGRPRSSGWQVPPSAGSGGGSGGVNRTRDSTEAQQDWVEFPSQPNLEWQTLDQHFQLGSRGGGVRGMKSESPIFKSHLTNKFSKSLKNLGERRLAELTNGFRSPEAPGADAHDASRSLGRSSSAPTGVLGSLGAASHSGSPAASPQVRRAQLLGDSAPLSAQSKGDPAYVPFKEVRWGLEASDRFKIYSSAKASRDRKDELQHSKRERPDFAKSLDYRCQLCFRTHKICPGHDAIGV